MITFWATALLTVCVPAAATSPSSEATAITTRQRPAATGYWTPTRMRAARDAADGLRWRSGGALARAVGKVFFTLDGTDYVCSGAVVASPGRDVVLTAAHCTGNGPGDWGAHWTFVPGYTGGAAPYGSYGAHRFYVSPRWSDQRGTSTAQAERYDVAFVAVDPSRTTGRRVGQAVGGLPVTFGGGSLGGRNTYVFGYPNDPPFGGQYADYCAGRARDAANGAASITCGMTAGDSGGPWITGFSPRTPTGTVAAVSTYKYSDGAPTLYGTRLASYAKALYEAASEPIRARRSGGPARSRRTSARRPSA